MLFLSLFLLVQPSTTFVACGFAMTTADTQQPQSSLRQRRNSAAKVSPQAKKANGSATVDKGPSDADESKQSRCEEIVWGKTPSGEGMHFMSSCTTLRKINVFFVSPTVFRVPTTHDVLTTLFHPGYPKSHLDLLNLGLLSLQLLLYFSLSRKAAQTFFFLYFAFWRTAYDAGLGWVLTKQSKKKWIVREVQRLGWLDEQRRPAVRSWIKKQLVGKMGSDYSFDVSICASILYLN